MSKNCMTPFMNAPLQCFLEVLVLFYHICKVQYQLNPYPLRTEHFDDFDDSDDSALTQDIFITIRRTSFKTRLWLQNLKIRARI